MTVGKLLWHTMMSLDGFTAGPNDDMSGLFGVVGEGGETAAEVWRPEVPLLGGNWTPGVVRVGDTVRRPRTRGSEFARELLIYLHHVGYDGAPRYLGVDDQAETSTSSSLVRRRAIRASAMRRHTQPRVRCFAACTTQPPVTLSQRGGPA